MPRDDPSEFGFTTIGKDNDVESIFSNDLLIEETNILFGVLIFFE